MPRLRSLFLLFVAAALTAAPRAAGAQPLGWLVPAGGETWTTGTTHTVEWTGGSPGWNVNVSVIRLSPFQVADNVELSGPNDGYASWTIPGGFPSGGYQMYIEGIGQGTWAYGPTFTVRDAPVCPGGCQHVVVSMPYFEPPAGACGATAAEAMANAQAYSQQQLASLCPSGYAIDPASVVTDVTLLPVGTCLTGYGGAFVAEASSVGCCCPQPVPAVPSSWGGVKSSYR